MKTNIFKFAAIVLLLSVSAFSCQKWIDKQLEKRYSPDCKHGDCVKTNIKGL